MTPLQSKKIKEYKPTKKQRKWVKERRKSLCEQLGIWHETGCHAFHNGRNCSCGLVDHLCYEQYKANLLAGLI